MTNTDGRETGFQKFLDSLTEFRNEIVRTQVQESLVHYKWRELEARVRPIMWDQILGMKKR